MESRNICKQNKSGGFTLVEILVVIGILVLIISFGAAADLNSLKTNNFQAKENTTISALLRARSLAMANIDQSSYGVCLIDGEYVVSKGTSCEIVFSQLSGDMFDKKSHTIHLSDGIKSADITINNEGAINW